MVRRYAVITIIVHKTHAFESDRKNAIDAGCNEFITKPFTKKLLLEKIDSAIQGENI